MGCLVSEPKDGVNAMDEVTKKQPSDDGRGGDAVIMDRCWKNQDEEKCGEEGKNREFNTHGAGEYLKGKTLKRRRNVDLLFPGTEIYEASLVNKTPQLCMFTDCAWLCNCCLREDERQQQASCQMENKAHVELVPKFGTETQQDKELYVT